MCHEPNIISIDRLNQPPSAVQICGCCRHGLLLGPVDLVLGFGFGGNGSGDVLDSDVVGMGRKKLF